jgi:transcription elongation factor Elf1
VTTDEGKRPFKCKTCEKNYVCKSVLKKHIASVHDARMAFKCENCDKRFSQKGDMITDQVHFISS